MKPQSSTRLRTIWAEVSEEQSWRQTEQEFHQLLCLEGLRQLSLITIITLPLRHFYWNHESLLRTSTSGCSSGPLACCFAISAQRKSADLICHYTPSEHTLLLNTLGMGELVFCAFSNQQLVYSESVRTTAGGDQPNPQTGTSERCQVS